MELYDFPFEISVRDISVSTLLNLDDDEMKSITNADLAIIDEIGEKIKEIRQKAAQNTQIKKELK